VETVQTHKWDDYNNDIPAIDTPLVFWFENRWITVDLGQENYDKYHRILHDLAAHGRKLKVMPRQPRHNRKYTMSTKAATVTAKPSTSKPRAGRSTAPANVAKRAKRSTMTKEKRRAITTFASAVMGVTVKPNGRIPKNVLERYEASQHTNGTANGSRPAVPTTPATTGVK
jgi:hypothetical protein